MVYQKDTWKEISQKRSDRAKNIWAKRKITEGVANAVLKPPIRRRSKLWNYITYIYLPLGFLAFMPAFIYLDTRTVLWTTVLWAAGFLALINMDEKQMEKEYENERVRDKNQ